MEQQQRIQLTRHQLDNGLLTDKCNQVIVRVPYDTEGRTTKSGIVVGFNKQILYAEGDDAHNADMQEVWGIVYRVPPKLWFDEKDDDSMPWECDMELQVGDKVWYGIMGSANCFEIECEGEIYKLLSYQDIYVAKRETLLEKSKVIDDLIVFGEAVISHAKIVPLNGYLLCQTLNCKRISDLDVTSDASIDKSRVIVRYAGTPNRRYRTKEICDHSDVRGGDEVLLEPRTPFLYLERKKYMAEFDGDNLYLVIPRRKVQAVLKRDNN